MDQVKEVSLGTTLTIAQVGAIHEQLLDIIRDVEDVVFDASQIERTDTAGLQCLYSFKASLEENGMTVQWDSPSEAIIASAEMLGLRESLELPPQ